MKILLLSFAILTTMVSCNALRDPALQAQVLALANEIARVEAQQEEEDGRK